MSDQNDPTSQNASKQDHTKRMKRQSRLTILLLLLAFVGVAFAVQMRQSYLKANEQIAWINNYKQGIQMGQQQNMPIMLEFTSKTCGPCTTMKTQVFSDKSIGQTVNNTVIPVRLDITSMDVQEANDLASQYKVWATPTYIMLSPDGSIVSRTSGAMPKDQFSQWVQINAQKQSPAQ